MTKELFVSSTPHETKVGSVEDDLLAEVYLERENEYTLAGSIYKGRVTRVLPGMQSAFVDIGLERDAFLYVSDFMELENQDDDLDEIPTQAAVPAFKAAAPERSSEPGMDAESYAPANVAASTENPTVPGLRENSASRDDRNGGQWRGRRRRGRRDRGSETRTSESRTTESRSSEPRGSEYRSPERRGSEHRGSDQRPEGRPVEPRGFEPRFSRPSQTESRPERDQYGPPPGYQPIILPGESISKYRGLKPVAPSRTESSPAADSYSGSESHSNRDSDLSSGLSSSNVSSGLSSEDGPAITQTFPDDEPLFIQSTSASGFSALESVPAAHREAAAEQEETHTAAAEIKHDHDHDEDKHRVSETFGTEEWDREQRRLHQMNVASVFGADQATEDQATDEDATAEHTETDSGSVRLENSEQRAVLSTSPSRTMQMEEEVIDEEEADMTSYVEDLEEDAAFEEFEEETHAASEHAHAHSETAADHQMAASAEPGVSTVTFSDTSTESVSSPAEIAHAQEEEVEVDDAAEVEAEIEEAQAQAEALLAAEAVGNGTVEARAEVRAPVATAAYTQRAPRPAFDRDRERHRRPRSGGGGRKFRRNEPQNLPLITDLLKEGQEIMVQIAKEPIGKKGARITSHIALPGRFLVYMPTVNHTGVSRKIASEEERLRLKRIIQSEREDGHGGFIVRTAAQGADEQELRADIRFLKGLWNEIRTRAENSKPPALIYHDLNVVERILRDQVTSDFSAIWVDTEQEYERILRFANRFQPALVRRVKLYTKETPLFEQFGLKDEIDKALKSKVWLKSGGYIVINQTEALVAIDVNTGKYVGKTARLEDTIVKTNVDAIKEIVRQIRLRDLGGIIIIDFIDMDERRNRQKVMQALEEALRSDRSPSKVLQFNDFGLVAITRKRVKQSLERTIGSPCPYCESTGYVKSVNTVCNEIYIEMRKLAKELDHADVMLRVNPEVAKALKTAGGRWLNELEELTKKTVIVKSDPALHQEQFDIN
jgi:ribonuclease G